MEIFEEKKEAKLGELAVDQREAKPSSRGSAGPERPAAPSASNEIRSRVSSRDAPAQRDAKQSCSSIARAPARSAAAIAAVPDSVHKRIASLDEFAPAPSSKSRIDE